MSDSSESQETWSDLRRKGWLDHTRTCQHWSNKACSCSFADRQEGRREQLA